MRGHRATVSYDIGFGEDILIAWSENARRAVTVYQTGDYDKSRPALTVGQLLRIANSFH